MAFPRQTDLLTNVSIDVNGTAVSADGGSKTVAIFATNFGTATVTLQGSPDNGSTWITLTIANNDAAFTANAIRVIDHLGSGMLIRAIVTGSTGTEDNINAKLF